MGQTLTEAQKALLAFIGERGRAPEEVAAFGGESDLQTLTEAGYVVLNGTGSDTASSDDTGQAPESVLMYTLTYAGMFEIPQP